MSRYKFTKRERVAQRLRKVQKCRVERIERIYGAAPDYHDDDDDYGLGADYDDDDEFDRALDDCGMTEEGECLAAGSEWCEFDCPIRRWRERGRPAPG